jgi:predicted nucleic acid-binding Zn ribbon protein
MRRATAGSRELAGRRARRRANLRGRSPGYSGPAPDGIDPQRLDAVLSEYVDDQGWELPLAQARVFAEWPSLVGAEVAAHCEPVTLRGGELRVSAESTAWATQLRLLSATMLARLVAELGPQVVTRLVISAPSGPSWRHGRFSVRGARGPRDTYG